MKNKMRFVYVLLVLMVMANVLSAVPADQDVSPQETPELQLEEDVITESDGNGGYLSTRDILLIVFAVIGLAAVL